MNPVKSKKVKLSCYHVEVKGDRRYSTYSILTLALVGVNDQCHAPAAIYPWHGFDKRLGGPQNCSGHRGYRKNPLPLLILELQSSSL
jgi:hypothetical protein